MHYNHKLVTDLSPKGMILEKKKKSLQIFLQKLFLIQLLFWPPESREYIKENEFNQQAIFWVVHQEEQLTKWKKNHFWTSKTRACLWR